MSGNIIAPNQEQQNATALEAWLDDRRRHVTATDAAKILTGKAFEVYLDKKGMSDRSDVPEHWRWGNRLQIPILEGYADKVGQAIIHADPYELVEDTRDALFGASLDARWKDGDRRPVDAKNIGFLDPTVWGPEYSDEIPDYYYVQLQMQMAVTKTEVADLAVLFGGRKLLAFRVAFDESYAADVYTICRDWWQKHIVQGVQPEVEGTEAWTKHLARSRQPSELVIDASAEVMEWAAELHRARLEIADAEGRADKAANLIKAFIGEHAGVAGPGFRAMFKKAQDQKKVDWPEYARVLEEQLMKEHPEYLPLMVAVKEKLTRTQNGSRSFRPTWKEQ